MKLNGQAAIVVGSARGIGAAIARTFSQEGAAIVLMDIEKMKPQLDEVAQEITRKGGKGQRLRNGLSGVREKRLGANAIAEIRIS